MAKLSEEQKKRMKKNAAMISPSAGTAARTLVRKGVKKGGMKVFKTLKEKFARSKKYKQSLKRELAETSGERRRNRYEAAGLKEAGVRLKRKAIHKRGKHDIQRRKK
jgi:hypothetical protein